jgi:hypothetical protein
VRSQTAVAVKEGYPAAGKELLKLMPTDPQAFARRLILSNHVENYYFKVPVLAYVDPATFVDVVSQLDTHALSIVYGTLEERYKHFAGDLVDEEEWLAKVASLLASKMQERKGRMSGYWLGLLAEAVRAGAKAVNQAAADAKATAPVADPSEKSD